MFSGRSVAMPYFFHVLTSCQLRCQKVGLLKCSVFLFVWWFFDCSWVGFYLTSRSSLFWFELSEDNEVWRRCFLFVLVYLILMWFPLRIFWLNRPRVQAGAQVDCAAHAIAGSGWQKTAIVVTGAFPAWWPSSAVGLVTVLLASRFDYVIALHISIFPYSAACLRCSVSWCGEFLFWACYCNSNDIPTLGFL